MMKKSIFIFFAAMSVFALSCKQSGDFLYTDIARIQFGPSSSSAYSQSATYSDSLKNQTFVYLGSDVLIDTVYFDIYTMGMTSNKDRRFTIKQDQVSGGNNAVPGIHYRSFSDPDVSKNYVIKAGKAHNRVPIILLRDASLKTSNVLLKFSIEGNEHFQVGQENLLWRKLNMTDRMIKPANWTEFYANTYFGSYSERKHSFFIDVTGQNWDEAFIKMIVADTQQLQYWLGLVKSALVAYNKAHPTQPMEDEFKQPVVIP